MESNRMKRLIQRYAVSELIVKLVAAGIYTSQYRNMEGGLTAEDHNGSQNTSSLGKAKLFASEISNRYNSSTPGSIEDSHEGVVKIFGVF
jgi:hypothetical protein